MPLAKLELTIQYTSPTPIVLLYLIPRIQFHPGIPLPCSQGLVKIKTKKKTSFKIIIGFFFTPPLFLATKVAISFVYYSPKTTKCTQKPKIEKKFTGIDQSSEHPYHNYNSLLRMRAIYELINVAVHFLLIRWQRIQVLCESRCVRYIHLQY